MVSNALPPPPPEYASLLSERVFFSSCPLISDSWIFPFLTPPFYPLRLSRSAKATQEADNVVILQHDGRQKRLEVKKNRYDGELGGFELFFDVQTARYREDEVRGAGGPLPAPGAAWGEGMAAGKAPVPVAAVRRERAAAAQQPKADVVKREKVRVDSEEAKSMGGAIIPLTNAINMHDSLRLVVG